MISRSFKCLRKVFLKKKVKSPFMIFANFQRILAAEGNRNQNFVELIQRSIKNIVLVVVVIN